MGERVNRDHILKELDDASNEKLSLDFKTELSKGSFVREIQGDLGNAIKENPNKVKLITPPWHVRLGRRLRKFFTKF